MLTITSDDGTTIAYDRSGDGPPVVIVAGAFGDRNTFADLAAQLAGRFTAVTYDRRGRAATATPRSTRWSASSTNSRP